MNFSEFCNFIERDQNRNTISASVQDHVNKAVLIQCIIQVHKLMVTYLNGQAWVSLDKAPCLNIRIIFRTLSSATDTDTIHE